MVNNSVKTFTLPIQKNTEREIFDYVDKYQSNLMPTTGLTSQLPLPISEPSKSKEAEETAENPIAGFLAEPTTDNQNTSENNTT